MPRQDCGDVPNLVCSVPTQTVGTPPQIVYTVSGKQLGPLLSRFVPHEQRVGMTPVSDIQYLIHLIVSQTLGR